MCDFIDEAFDEDTLSVQAKMENIKTYIYVEGLDDVEFWSNALKNKEIDVSSTSQDEKRKSHKGKGSLIKLIKNANKNLIIAIDSDYDYLCPTHNQDAIDINNCNFVIHTYFYSKENVILQPTVIDLCLEKTKLNNEKIASNFRLYISEYSKIIYECLVKFLFLKNLSIKTITGKEFNPEIIPENPIFDSSYNLKNNPFKKLNHRIKSLEQRLDHEISKINNWEHELNEYKNSALEKGLSNDTSYCFIQGHLFEDSIVAPYVDGKIKALKRNLMLKVRNECKSTPELIPNRCIEISNILNKNHSFKTRVNDCEEKYNHDIINKINESFLIATC